MFIVAKQLPISGTAEHLSVENFNKCSAVAEMGDRLATIDMGRKWGAVPLLGGGWVPMQHSTAWA